MESGSVDTDRKYVLFVATAAGLGHLLKALLNSAYYAYRTGRVLALDMRDNLYSTGDKHAAFFEHFSLELPPDLEVITDLDVIDQLRQDEDLHFLKLETDRLNVDRPFPERVLLIPCLVPGEPYPISAKHKDLPFRVMPRGNLLEALHAAMRRPEWSGPVIGLHYRSTVGEVTERMTKALTPDYDERYREVKDRYIATALTVAEEAGYTDPAFLVTSDDAEFVSYVKERLPNSFSLAKRWPDQEVAAWIRAHGHDFDILSDTVNDLWCLSACDHLVHFRSDFSNFAALNSPKLDRTTMHYVHVPALKEILESLDPEEAVAWARGAVRKAAIRRIQLRYLSDWLADALDRVGQTEAAQRERQRAQWHWECNHAPVVDNPGKPEVMARAQRGDFGGLLAVARQATQELPGNPYWLAGYGGSLSNVLAQLGRWEEAILPARQALEIEPEDPFLYEHLGFVLSGTGALQEGEQAIRQAIAIDGEIGRFHSALGTSLTRQGRSAEAVEAFREAARLEPDDPYMVRRLGSSLVALGDFASAEATFRQALAMRSEAGPHIDLYDCFIRQGRQDEALAEAQAAVTLEPTNPNWHYRVALTMMHTERLAEAEVAARAAVANGSGMSVFQDLLAQILQRQGRTNEVVTTMRQVAELEPEDAQRQLRLARALLEGEELAAAEEAAQRAAALQPDLVQAYDLLSVIMGRQNRPAESLAAAQRAAELMPQDSGRQHRVGLLLFHSGDMTGAEHALREAQRLASEAPTFHNHYLLSIVLERQGRIEESIVEARNASDLARENADLMVRLAVLLLTVKRIDEAEVAVRQAVSLRPDEERSQRLLAAVIEQRREAAQEPAAASAPPAEVFAQENEPEESIEEPAAAYAAPAEVFAREDEHEESVEEDAPAYAAPPEVFAREDEQEESMEEPDADYAPPAEVFSRVDEPAMPPPERVQQKPARWPRRQWMSGTALSWPLRQILTGKPKSDG
jgi:Flp pilus assembly protein TadD